MKIDGSLKSLLQGVSQQPMRDRLPGQCTAQVNLTPDPINGLTRRPPTDLVNRLLVTASDAVWHEFRVKNGNNFIAAVVDGNVHVWDYNGNEKTVANPASSYLGANIRMTTLDNTTYIVNRDVVPAMLSGVQQYFNTGTVGRGIVTILGGAYGRNYSISIDGNQVALYATPSGATPAADAIQSSPRYIMGSLVTQLQSNPAIHEITTDGNNVITFSLDTHFSLSVSDDQGGTNIKGVTDYITRVEDLPAKAPDNYMIRVASKADPDKDVFYKFVAANPISLQAVEGYWQETVAPGISYAFNPATMPMVMEYLPDTDSFSLNQSSWKGRQVGTEVSNPNPSFIGTKIEDVFSFQSRLGFLAGPNACMSRTNRSDDFWKASATALADTDPIDISSKSIKGSLLSATLFNKDLVLMTTKSQFVIFGRTVVTPKTAALVLTTSFEATLAARPVPAGRNIFFSNAFGRFSGIREFYTEGSTDINDSRAVTQHVQKYIIGDVQHMAASSNYEILLVQSGDANNLYCYKYIWADNNKVQAAWGQWTFQAPVRYMFFEQELVYLIMKHGSTYSLHRMSLDQVDSENVGFPIYMDSRFDVTGMYQSFALPYDYLNDYDLIVVQGQGCPNPGMTTKIVSKMYVSGTGWVYTTKENMQGGNVLVGVPFRSSYIPNQPQVKDQDGIPIGTSKLMHRNYIVSLSQTADISAVVRTSWTTSEPIVYRGRTIGDIGNKVGSTAVNDDKFIVPVREEAQYATTELSTESVYPMTMLDIEWTGQYNKKGRRIAIGGKS